jgi:uncharacterized protein YjbJ (UPF0337 family)
LGGPFEVASADCVRQEYHNREIWMNWDQIAGNWKVAQGKAREQWGKLTDDEMAVVAGNRDQLIGKVQARYGVSKEEAARQVDDWQKGATDKV